MFDSVPAGGAHTAEVLQTVGHIRTGDADSCHAAWSATADRGARASRCCALIRTTARRSSFSRRAIRSADRPPGRNIAAFYAGLDALGVVYERFEIPYGERAHLNAVYYPAPSTDPAMPLIMIGSGYDSTVVELYFVARRCGR